MAKLQLVKGTTSYRAYVFIGDSSVSTGAGKTGLAFNTASLKAYYVRPGATATAITLVTQTVTGAYSSGGFIEIDSTNMPGVYRLDVPDAALATGVNAVVVMLSGATNMAPCVLEVELTEVNNQDATAFGVSRLDAAVTTRLAPTVTGRTLDVTATGAAGIDWANVENPTTAVNLSATNIDTDQVVASVTGAVGSVTGSVTVGTNSDKTGYSLASGAITAAVVATGAIDADALAADAAAEIADAVWDEARAGHVAAGSFGEGVASVQGNITGSVASLTTNNDKTGYSLSTTGIDAVLDRTDAIETGLTPRQSLRLMAAALAGKLSGAATTTITIRNAVADSKARITATVDADGNRSAMTTDVS